MGPVAIVRAYYEKVRILRSSRVQITGDFGGEGRKPSLMISRFPAIYKNLPRQGNGQYLQK